MVSLRRIIRRLSIFFRRDRLEREMDEELRTHLEMEIEDNLRTGMEPEEARRRAMIAFGGVERLSESRLPIAVSMGGDQLELVRLVSIVEADGLDIHPFQAKVFGGRDLQALADPRFAFLQRVTHADFQAVLGVGKINDEFPRRSFAADNRKIVVGQFYVSSRGMRSLGNAQ